MSWRLAGWLVTQKYRPGFFTAQTFPVHDKPKPIPDWIYSALIV